MTGRPIFDAQLGEFFEALRVRRGLNSLRMAADVASRRGLPRLTKSVLERLESGQTKNPEPDVLRDVATLYGRSYEAIVREFVRRRFAITEDAPAESLPPLPDPLPLDVARVAAALEAMGEGPLRASIAGQVLETARELGKEPPPERIAQLARVSSAVAGTTRTRTRRRQAPS